MFTKKPLAAITAASLRKIPVPGRPQKGFRGARKKPRGLGFRANLELYLFFLMPTLVMVLLFRYLPMYGVQIAFRNFIPTRGFWGSPWVGLDHFMRFFRSYKFAITVRNTLLISLYQLVFAFPFPIILAIMLNQVRNDRTKRFIQTVTYAPNFISIVVLIGLLNLFLSPRIGLVNNLISRFGGQPIFFLGKPELFKPLYVASGIWQGTGWGAIIYIAALSGISPDLYEAARIDGANRFKRIWYIDLPSIAPTIIILLILSTGQMMSVGFEKAFLMQNPTNLDTSEVISTYVYKVGLVGGQFSFGAAVGLFNAVINLILLLTVNRIARKVSEVSLF